jgi:hypothetical protein
MKMYKAVSLFLAAVFAVVGIIFLVIPGNVVAFFNDLSSSLGMEAVPVAGYSFYLILAVGYMYLVTILAALMYRHPENTAYPRLLCHGKFASAALSILLFIVHRRFLLYLANGIVDGAIGIVVLLVYLRKRRIDR